MQSNIQLANFAIGAGEPLVFILGPCVIESREHTLLMAEKLAALAEELRFPLVFKASFDKANRTDLDSYRGPGLEKGLVILEEVKNRYHLPILTDIHEPNQAEAVAKVVDIIQIPAFLCRQTDLVLAAARTGKIINVKKGQFMQPADMRFVVKKIESTGNHQILLTERGVSFGYGTLITDIRAVPILQATGYPVIFDATHSAQLPGGMTTGGQRAYIPHHVRAMVAAGCDGIFMEVHDNVDQALSDRATQYPLQDLPQLIRAALAISNIVRELKCR
jgi:2-dehydro-3-deoxyphosphooctonate aldolase (KDO 8-P synthase)